MATWKERYDKAWERIKAAHGRVAQLDRDNPLLAYATWTSDEKYKEKQDPEQSERIRAEMISAFWLSKDSYEQQETGVVAVTIMENYATKLEEIANEQHSPKSTQRKLLLGNEGLVIYRNAFALPEAYLESLGD